MQTRRQFTASAAALAATLLDSACAPLDARRARQRDNLGLVPVRVSPGRIIRTDVGVRPYRRSGFVVSREALGSKALIHNYGHGGGGVTLSWGTASLAADLGFSSAEPACAVLGCGAVGLATARVLQERGATVRIYAHELPPHTTSNVAGAQWWPAAVFGRDELTPAFEQQFQAAARLAFERFRNMTGARYGVRWMSNFVLSRAPVRVMPAPPGSPLLRYAPDLYDLAPGEHPFPARYVRHFRNLMIDSPLYLQALMADVRAAGGEIVVRRFDDLAQISALPENTVFNCTGLGAAALFNDNGMTPVRGQLLVLRPQADVNYSLLADRGLYMFPRSDGILLGGTHDYGVGLREADADASARILAGHQALFTGMRRGKA
jgi:glycine/D-amino acid oxidase-like deaminating enzyme